MTKRMLIAAAIACALVRGQSDDARPRLIRYLNGIAFARLDERKHAVEALQTRADAERRKQAVREKVLRMIGGLPEKRGPARRFPAKRTKSCGGTRMESGSIGYCCQRFTRSPVTRA